MTGAMAAPERGASALAGARVLVTASAPGELCALLEAKGAVPVAVPTIAIRPADPAPLDAALARGWDWIVVTSPNGARAVAARLAGARRAARPTAPDAPPGARWGAVGPRTRAALQEAGIEAAAVPDEGTGAAIADAMGEVRGLRVLLARARHAARDLPEALSRRGARVQEVVAYETEEGPEDAREPLARALAAGLDAAVFTSGSTVRGFARLAGEPALALGDAVVVAIGPSTADAARAAGLSPVAARGRTPAAIVAALERAPLRAARG